MSRKTRLRGVGIVFLQVGIAAACWGGANLSAGDWFPTFVLVDGIAATIGGALCMIGAMEV